MGKQVEKPDPERCCNYIRKRLLDECADEVSLSSVSEMFGYSKTQLRNFEKTFREAGDPIRVINNAFVFAVAYTESFAQRGHTERHKKRSIGQVAADFIMNEETGPRRKEEPVFETEFSTPADLKSRLSLFWRRPNRTVILDASSTSEAIAFFLGQKKTPSRHVGALLVVTNGVDIVNTLALSDFRHSAIMIGGVMRWSAKAMVGMLAERNLDAMGLQADMAIVGTAGLNVPGEFCSRDESEAATKTRLLRSASIRCIAAHSDKFVERNTTGMWAFAPCSPDFVDVVFTDRGIFNERSSTKKEANRAEFLGWLEERGICLATERPQGKKGKP